MNIQDAVKKALACDGYIVPAQWEGRIKILPTNTPECCIAFIGDQNSYPRWEPNAADLIADDWTVIQKERGQTSQDT